VISPAGNFKLYLASKPVDFRKGMDGLAAIVQREFNLDPRKRCIELPRSELTQRFEL